MKWLSPNHGSTDEHTNKEILPCCYYSNKNIPILIINGKLSIDNWRGFNMYEGILFWVQKIHLKKSFCFLRFITPFTQLLHEDIRLNFLHSVSETLSWFQMVNSILNSLYNSDNILQDNDLLMHVYIQEMNLKPIWNEH